PRVATVTPLTNHGTIAAVPVWNRNNDLPPNHTIDSFAALIEGASARTYPELPTGVGFCMLVRRDAIDSVGLLDEVTFGRGYGEENDFCLRATALGYQHLLDDATFVHHEGGQSFGSDSQPMLQANYRVLLQKHPAYGELIRQFLERNSLADIQNSIRRCFDGTTRRRLRVLVLLHHSLNVIGGTEAHVLDLTAALEGADVLVAYREASVLVVKEYRCGVEVQSTNFTPPTASEIESRDWCRRLLGQLRVEVIHIEHLLNQSTAIVNAASDLGIPIVFVWEDYYLICPNYNLLNDAGKFCDWCRDLDECDRCLGRQGPYPAGFQRAWRQRNQKLNDKIDAHVFLSEASLEGVNKVFSIKPERVRIIPHARSNSRRVTEERSARQDRPLRVAFLGVQLPQKGITVFSRILESYGNDGVEWHTFGAWPPPAPSVDGPGIVHHGAYDREGIAEVLNAAGIDVVLLLSTWPETFCFTLTEAWQAGIPVVGSELGAIGERIARSGAGWTVDPEKPEEIAALLR
ncbi:MAG: glycosyltransferase, partial [Candidatus Binatia bacterium]